jgi:unsaturated chondroitin disaccharide hydrolase
MTLLRDAVDFAGHQVRRTIATYPDFYPMYTTAGNWKHPGEVWTHWCEGFFPGMMWLLWEYTGDGWWREQAERYSKPLEPRRLDRNVHDLGFIFMSTYLPWFRATSDKAIQSVLVQAGRTLAMRFQPRGQYLCSFLGPASLFIDIMMNVGVIFYAAGVSRDRALWDVATRHCLTTRRYLVRGDGSTSHEGIFDTNSGEFLRQTTQQGWRNDSCWSRGLAWALYGFGAAFHYSRDSRFLQTARACADFYLRHSPPGGPDGGVAPWDYDAPEGPERFPDTSAAAIAAAGLVRLAQLTGEETYRASAEGILRTLCQRYLARDREGWEGVLTEGVYHKHKGLGVRESVIWGDYFFLEALTLVLGGNGLREVG